MNSEKYNILCEAIKKDKGWFNNFIKLCREYYKEHASGGNLHIVLDDGNLDRDSVKWCAGYVAGAQDDRGIDIANLMLWMTMKQKRRVYCAYSLYSPFSNFW